MLKCLVSREFLIDPLFEAWDYLLAGFKHELYDPKEDILDAKFDQLHHLNYLCLALIYHSKNSYLLGDYVDCL